MAAKLRKGIFWYTRETYERMEGIAADAKSFNPAFDKWEASLKAQLAKASGNGVEYVKVIADIDDFLSWCAEHEKIVDASSRRAYADEVANEPASTASSDLSELPPPPQRWRRPR